MKEVELKLLAESGATVGHCPHKCAKMAFAMESLDQYLAAGVRIGLGTDTYPLDIVSEMRYASLISRLVDKNASGARPSDLFNAATVGGRSRSDATIWDGLRREPKQTLSLSILEPHATDRCAIPSMLWLNTAAGRT